MTTTEKKKYRKNFLTNVICRIDFRPIAEIDSAFLNKFRTIVKSNFPKVKEQTMVGIETKIEKGECVSNSQLPGKSIFNYLDINEENSIILSDNYLAIESVNYTSYKEFSKHIDYALTNLTDCFKDIDFIRLGLRSINQIVLDRGNPLIWKNYIEPSFVSVIDRFFDRSENLARMMSQVVLNYDDYKVNFNYGMHNSEFPAKISRKEFILDFDFYTEYVENNQIMYPIHPLYMRPPNYDTTLRREYLSGL